MLPDWLVQAVVLGVCAIAWAEIRGLRNSRHEHNNKLAALSAGQQLAQQEVEDLKITVTWLAGAVREVRDALIATRIIKPGATTGFQFDPPPG